MSNRRYLSPKQKYTIISLIDNIVESENLSVYAAAKRVADMPEYEGYSAPAIHALYSREMKKKPLVPIQEVPNLQIEQFLNHVRGLVTENESLKKEVTRLQAVEQEYLQLCKAFETARKTIFPEENLQFKVDKNGILERMN